MRYPIPEDDLDRLSTLRSYDILDTPPEEAFDRVSKLASAFFDVPVALVNLVDENRLWVKSCVGIEVDEVPRDVAFCSHTIVQSAALVVPDMLKDDRFRDNPLVTGDPHVRFYAGVPLLLDGHNLGTVCLLDFKPREFDDVMCQQLQDFAHIVCDQLELRLVARDIDSARQAAEAATGVQSGFLGSMARELKAPLNSVLGFAQLLKKELAAFAGDEQKIYIDQIIANTSHLAQTVDDVLELDQMEKGQKFMPLGVVRVAQVVDDSIAKADAEESGLRVDWNPDAAQSLRCTASESHLQRALNSLLVNTAKSKSASGRIRIEAHQKDGTVWIKLTDPNAELYSSPGGGKSTDDITLAIAQRLVERMQGEFVSEDHPVKGRTYSLGLKAAS